MLDDLPERCTPEQVAQHLLWNKAGVLRAIRKGELRAIRLTNKHIIIEREDLILFKERKKCPGITKDCKSREGPTGEHGKSGNISKESGSDIDRVLAALNKLKPKDTHSNENNVSGMFTNSQSA